MDEWTDYVNFLYIVKKKKQQKVGKYPNAM